MLLLLACTPTWTEDCTAADGDCSSTESLVDSAPLVDSDPPGDSAPEGWVAELEGKDLWFDTIQEAIVEADDGDTVWVAPGTHYENIDFHGKGIRVVSVAGPLATVLDGGGTDSVVQIRAKEPSTAILEGFTITNGEGTENHGGGVFVENADPIIRYNIFVGNHGGVAGGVYLRHGEAVVHNNLIVHNDAQVGGGLVCTNCKGEVRFNTFYMNDAEQAGPAGEWFFEPQGDFVANVVVVPEGSEYAFRYMEPQGYTFEADYNLLYPDVPWADSDTADGSIWPVGDHDVRGDPLLVNPDAMDFSLGEGSPAIDVGPPELTDADGSPADLGAFGGPEGDWDPAAGWDPG